MKVDTKRRYISIRVTRREIPEDSKVATHCLEIFKSQIGEFVNLL